MPVVTIQNNRLEKNCSESYISHNYNKNINWLLLIKLHGLKKLLFRSSFVREVSLLPESKLITQIQVEVKVTCNLILLNPGVTVNSSQVHNRKVTVSNFMNSAHFWNIFLKSTPIHSFCNKSKIITRTQATGGTADGSRAGLTHQHTIGSRRLLGQTDARRRRLDVLSSITIIKLVLTLITH